MKPLALSQGLWVVLAIAVAVKALAIPHQHSVWPVFETASENWWHNETLYTPEDGLDSYRYSPTFAITLTPIAALPIRIGGAIWGILGIAVAYLGLRSIVRASLPPFQSEYQEALYLTASALGVGSMSWNLQSNALVLGLIAFGASAATQRRWWLAGVLLCAPAFVKIWPGAFALMLMMKWPRYLIVPFVSAGLALGAFPLLTATPIVVLDTYGEWWQTLVHSTGNRWPGYRDMAVVWESLGLPLDATVYRCTQLVFLLLLAGFWRVVQNRVNPAASVVIALTVWLCWQMLFGPGSEQSTYGMLVPFMAWWTVAAWQRGWQHRWLVVPLVSVIACSCGSIENAVDHWVSDARCLLPLSVATFAGWFVVMTLRNGFGLTEQTCNPEAVSQVAVGEVTLTRIRRDTPASSTRTPHFVRHTTPAEAPQNSIRLANRD